MEIKNSKTEKTEKEDDKDEEQGWMRRTWNWLWHSDSILSWIVSLILAFLIVKFIIFPVLSLVFATSLPLVVVESSSMHHPGNFLGEITSNILPGNSFNQWYEEKGKWYENKNITRSYIEKWDFKNGFDKGDIILVTGWDKNLEVGDVIIFNANQAHPIIHRVIRITEVNGEKIYSTKGDNNVEQLVDEKIIKEQAVIGKAILRLPKLGWVKLAFVQLTGLFK